MSDESDQCSVIQDGARGWPRYYRIVDINLIGFIKLLNNDPHDNILFCVDPLKGVCHCRSQSKPYLRGVQLGRGGRVRPLIFCRMQRLIAI